MPNLFSAVTDQLVVPSSAFKSLNDHYLNDFVQKCKKKDVVARDETFFETKDKISISTGMRRFYRFCDIWNNAFKYKPEGFQCYFQRYIIQLFAPILLGDDWFSDGAGLMKEMGWTHIRQGLLGITARRMGKSIIVSQATVSIMCVVSGLDIAILTTGRRASTALKNQCKNNMIEIGIGDYIGEDNQEILGLKMPNFEKASLLRSLPAGEDVRTSFIFLGVCVYIFIIVISDSKKWLVIVLQFFVSWLLQAGSFWSFSWVDYHLQLGSVCFFSLVLVRHLERQ